MKLKERKAFVRTDLQQCDSSITYLQSGFLGVYIQICEDVSYMLDIKYVDDEEVIKKLSAKFKEEERLDQINNKKPLRKTVWVKAKR